VTQEDGGVTEISWCRVPTIQPRVCPKKAPQVEDTLAEFAFGSVTTWYHQAFGSKAFHDKVQKMFRKRARIPLVNPTAFGYGAKGSRESQISHPDSKQNNLIVVGSNMETG